MSFLEERKARTREKRLSALSHFHGTLEGLIDEASGTEIKQKIRTFTQIHEDEIIYAFRVLSKIKDAVVIVNGAIGCGALGIAEEGRENYRWYSTNLVERDTILGGDEKLRDAVLRAKEENRPKAIFILGTPVVAINNDDVHAAILELEEEVGVPIIEIYTDGFKSKTPLTGYDIVTHSLLRYLVKKENVEEKENFVNVISFSESIEDVAAIASIFKDLGISYQFLPQFSTVEQIRNASKAKATVVLNAEEGRYFAEELEEVFQVPYIVTDSPIGYRGTRSFLLKLAKVLGIEEQAYTYIEEKETQLKTNIEQGLLEDKKVFLDFPLAKIGNIANFVDALGGTTVGIGIPEVDFENREYLQKLSVVSKGSIVIVGNGQYFEKANAIEKLQPDLYIGQYADGISVTQEGVTVLSTKGIPIYGFCGVSALARQIEKLDRVEAVQKADEQTSKYKSTWKKRSGNWYVKQEVR